MSKQKFWMVIALLLVGCGVANAGLYSTDFENPPFANGLGATINEQDGWSTAWGNEGDTAVDNTLVGIGQAAIIRGTTSHSSRASHYIGSAEGRVSRDFTASFDLGFNVPDGGDTMEQAWVGFLEHASDWGGAEVGIRIDGDKMRLAYKTYDGAGGSWVLGAEVVKDKYYHYEVALNVTSFSYDVVVYDGATELMNVTDISFVYAEEEDSAKYVVFHACSWTGSNGVAYLDNLDIVSGVVLDGDANADGVVSAGDYASVQANFGRTGEPGGVIGDANGDGVVSAGDYASVQANFGNTVAASVVPEPATMCLLIGGGLALIRRKK